MGNLTVWTLPINPPSPPGNALLDLTSEQNGRVYYTKTRVTIVGELTLTASGNNVKEWTIPPALVGPWPGSFFIGRLTFSPSGLLWFSLPTPQRLIEFNPTRGSFTAYEGMQTGLSAPFNLMFDQRSNLWYIGDYSQGGQDRYLIGRFDRSRERVDVWPLPFLNHFPNDLWVDATGKVVWMIFGGNTLKPGPLLGALVPSTNKLTYWAFPFKAGPVGLGIAGDRLQNPANIWLTHDPLIPGEAAVFRLNVVNSKLYVYRVGDPEHPVGIGTDGGGNAWIGFQNARISTIQLSADCGSLPLKKKTISLEPRRKKVQAMHAIVKPRLLGATLVENTVTSRSRPCITDFSLPNVWSTQIRVGGLPTRPIAYFTSGGSNMIGRLIP